MRNVAAMKNVVYKKTLQFRHTDRKEAETLFQMQEKGTVKAIACGNDVVQVLESCSNIL